MKIILYDSILTGHHSEYIIHLVNCLCDKTQSSNDYIFVVPNEFRIKFKHIVLKTKQQKFISWEFISDDKVVELQNLSLLKRSFKEFKLVKYYASKFKADSVFFLYFNVFQIATILAKSKFNISGILFLQFARMPKVTLKDKVKYLRKYYVTKLYSKNKFIKNVFILNDDSTANYLNSEFNTDIFRMLPDPIPDFIEEEGFDVYKEYNISRDKKILLHPGSIDPRKGTYEIIDSLDFLNKESLEKYAILIIGKAKSEVETQIKNRINSLRNKDTKIIFKNTFVSNERLKSLFIQSEAVLIPYKNTEASSGILGHAVKANKTILAPNKGLVGEIIRDFNLGVLLDDITSEDIAVGISKIKNHTNNIKDIDRYINLHTTEAFVEKMFCEISKKL